MAKLMILCSMAVLALLLHGTTAVPLPSGVPNPCSQQARDNNEYHFAHPGSKNKFIQCDEHGNAYELTCQPGLHWSVGRIACDWSSTTITP